MMDEEREDEDGEEDIVSQSSQEPSNYNNAGDIYNIEAH